MERNFFGSLRNKLTGKDSNKNASDSQKSPKPSASRAMPPTNPFSSSAPATRRPDRAGMNAFTTPSTEPPPAYTPAPAPGSASAPIVAPQMPNAGSAAKDDRYAFLSTFDTAFLIDDSGSMAGRSWRETAKALEAITPICTAHDADGIDIYFLNARDSAWYQNITAPSTVTEIFSAVRPQGGTPTGQRLNQILKPYLAKYTANPEGTKPLNIIVITDGEPSDDVESPIINIAKKLDKLDAPAWQIGIQFFQVGREPGAREHLKQLDDELQEIAGCEIRDIVDTVPFTGDSNQELNADGIMKVVLGSVNRRLDRRRSKDMYRK
ncbi:hypothetical protein EJ08DRAFT_649406 [Tothia fuscella]|uniref:VWFA domain-containing protein n=1 Tax=Tothia fuscella TaxID=1048955 RepID=A0A9P4NRL9_9PEZI|nr:hypothetical protein EJ08DRAFT_649406 [Tothia fuscella]